MRRLKPHVLLCQNDHGAQEDRNRHVGDLGNIVADTDYKARVRITDDIISLSGKTNVLGRAIVVHEKEDDLGRGGNKESLAAGNAGPRAGCCIIVHRDDRE
ncbi:unnamed protein product [Darwinula stevensoni]|uniref:Superoxide dismutase [Cu-Zn] n=1 Tax=Darwinula stevensoni TaxID=69355 RepID=A0A7R8XCZ9_9CRUS|nr:unnamed protein product [Darwinula stevensoni]CAG0894263.1 unnamed protein product [Darwinula stevensoni]